MINATLEDLFTILGNTGEKFDAFSMRIQSEYNSDDVDPVMNEFPIPDVPEGCDEMTKDAH